MTCLRNVKFLSSDCDNTGDHYAMSKSMNFVVRNVSELSSCDLAPVSHPQWNNKSFLNAYKENLRLGLQVIEPVKFEGLSKDTAQISVNRLNKQLCETMHNSVSASVSECDQKKIKVNKWWNYNCTQARNRYRIFYHIWNSCGRPGSGEVYNCYRSARKLYRKTCRIAVNYQTNQTFQCYSTELFRGIFQTKV